LPLKKGKGKSGAVGWGGGKLPFGGYQEREELTEGREMRCHLESKGAKERKKHIAMLRKV